MGAFCLVLHTHLPYVRRNGVWPSGEDFAHQAAVESYLPLLGVFRRLADAGLRDAFTLGLSPMVAHQMADAHMRRELEWYLGQMELRAWRQASSYDGWMAPEIRDLAGFYARFAREQGEVLDSVSDLARGFADLARAGAFEIIGGPLTHPYLPLVSEPSLAALQVSLGAREHERILGARPAGMWLPECAYDPATAIETLLEQNAVTHTVVDGPTLIRSGGTTSRPARIGSSAVMAFGRDLDVTYRVWSPTGGYPTGKWYRDFFHYDVVGGFKNWRVTSVQKPLHEKRAYEPARAVAAARADAADFVAVIARRLTDDPDGVVVAGYDTELFGHWWFEGPTFLEELFTLLPQAGIEPLSLAAARERYSDAPPIDLVAGTWGFRKDERSWVSADTEDMWSALAAAEAETVALVATFTDAAGARAEVRDQMVRELLLLQASDWPFMVIRGRNAGYARERFFAHHGRWRWLADCLVSSMPDDQLVAEARSHFDRDNIAPGLTF